MAPGPKLLPQLVPRENARSRPYSARVRARPLHALLVLVVVVATVGCKKPKDGDATKVTASSTDDATKPIVDEDFRFELAWPGAGWKLSRERDVQRFVPDAIAGAIMGESLFGVVIVESAPGAQLDEFTDLLVEQLPLTDKKVESRERIKYAGQDSNRYVVSGTLNGVDFRYVNHVFVRDAFVYQVLGWGTQKDLSTTARELAPMFAAFKLTPGKVRARTRAPISTAEGVGWRVRDGVFESAVSGMRAKPADPWRLLIGDDLARVNADADIGLAHVNPDVYVVLISERAPPAENRAAFANQVRAAIQGDRGEPHVARFVDHELEMMRVTATTGVKFEYLHGLHYAGDRVTQVLAWFHAADRDRAMKVLPTGLAGVSEMPEAETTALLAELGQRRDTQVAIGPGYSLRSGVYRSFANGWQWTKPPGLWTIRSGDAARAFNAVAELVMVENARNLYSLVIPAKLEGRTPREFHAVAAGELGGKTVDTRTVGTATVTTIDPAGNDAMNLRYDVATIANNEVALQIVTWGMNPDMDRSRAAIDALIAGVAIAPMTTSQRENGEYRDLRFGFAVREPGVGFAFDDQTPTETGAITTFVTWTKGLSAMVGVVGVYFATVSEPDEAWTLDYLEQSIRDRVGKSVFGRAKRSDGILGGHPARVLTWDGLTAHVLVRDRLVYAFLSTGTAPITPSGFRLLD